jgi:hypothetical protein
MKPGDTLEKTAEFACLHSTHHGKVLFCREYGRLVVDFQGLYFVFRPWEFQRFRHHFTQMLTCPMSRSRLQAGDCIHVRDSLGHNALTLRLTEVEELAALLEAAAPMMSGSLFLKSQINHTE